MYYLLLKNIDDMVVPLQDYAIKADSEFEARFKIQEILNKKSTVLTKWPQKLCFQIDNDYGLIVLSMHEEDYQLTHNDFAFCQIENVHQKATVIIQ